MKTRIVYEDQDILICHKPAGLATQSAGVLEPDMVSELKNHLCGGYLGMIHRLDQPVEGLLVFARNKQTAAELSRQLTKGILRKRYCALVYGSPCGESGRLEDYLRKEGSLARVVSMQDPGARRAVLEYRVRQPAGDGTRETPDGRDRAGGNHTCLDITIETGRFHQIRCQLSHQRMPILGDRKYGTEESLEESRRMGIRHVALCACGIQLLHPATGQEISHEIVPAWAE